MNQTVRFRNLSLRRRLTLLILCSSILGLVLACTGLAAYERNNFRASTLTELSALADTLGANVAASLLFDDSKTGDDMLRALATEPHVMAARLYDANGKIFAEYRRSNVSKQFQAPAARTGGRIQAGHAYAISKRFAEREKAGSIEIVSDLTGLRAEIWQFTKISVLVLAFSLLATYLVTSRLLKLAIHPILRLAALAEKFRYTKTIPCGEKFRARTKWARW